MSEFKVETGEAIVGNFSQIIPSKTAFELKSLL
jgi:hypothetical protein